MPAKQLAAIKSTKASIIEGLKTGGSLKNVKQKDIEFELEFMVFANNSQD